MEKRQKDGKQLLIFILLMNKIYFCFDRNFPDYFYTFSLWQNDKQKKLVDFVMLDTVILCGGADVLDWDHTPLNGPENNYLAEAYWQWVEEQFRQSTYEYTHPVT